MTSWSILGHTAKVLEERRDDYGDPADQFKSIAARWSITLDMPVTPAQVALCMIDLKLARLAYDPRHADSVVDVIGYATRYDVDPLVHRAAGLGLLADLDARLADQSYLGGATRGFTDIALFPFVRQFAAVDAGGFATRAPAAVRRWLDVLTASELFQQAMIPVAPWAEARI